MARRLTSPSDTAIINSEFKRLDLLQKQIAEHAQQLAILNKHVGQIRQARAIPSTNNMVFTWTGTTLTLSWAAGYIQDQNLKNYAIPAGSRVLLASTGYWVAWNPIQQQMVINQNLQVVVSGVGGGHANTPNGAANVASGNNLVICAFATSDNVTTVNVGGGGILPGGVGPSGMLFKKQTMRQKL